MTNDVDDVHAYDTGFIQALKRLDEMETSDENKKLIHGFVMGCRRDGLAKSTITNYVNLLKRMIDRLNEIDFTKNLDQLEQNDFDELLMHIEDVRGLSPGEVRNYKKVTKRFYRHLYDDEIPKWVSKLKLTQIETLVQPSDLLTKDELKKLVESCRHPRDKALIAVLADSGLRVGALASCRIKNVEFNQYGGIIYISTTSRSKKTASAKGIPITWSTGYLNQWLAVHPLNETPDAPLWVTLNEKMEPLSYKSIRMMVKRVGEDAEIKKRVNPHSLRHKAITTWLLDGCTEAEVKHRACWSKGSQQMLKIYANFTDGEMNDKIYERYGLKTEDKRAITLTKCPRCSNILQVDDRFCSQCSLILDSGLSNGVDANKMSVAGAMSKALNDPATMLKMAALLAETKTD